MDIKDVKYTAFGIKFYLKSSKDRNHIWMYEAIEIVFKIISWSIITQTLRFAATKLDNNGLLWICNILTVLIVYAIGERLAREFYSRIETDTADNWVVVGIVMLAVTCIVTSFGILIVQYENTILTQLLEWYKSNSKC